MEESIGFNLHGWGQLAEVGLIAVWRDHREVECFLDAHGLCMRNLWSPEIKK